MLLATNDFCYFQARCFWAVRLHQQYLQIKGYIYKFSKIHRKFDAQI